MNGGYGTSGQPLAGAILCCTSIPPEERQRLGIMGADMGATIKLDLTSDVTHLIVGNINSAKYRYVAKSREDVKVVSPEWLDGMRDEWLKGGEVDVAAIEHKFRLPTFFGLKICLTGFDDAEQRRYIQEVVTNNGAEYHGDLTKSVTHLIAATPTGKKYEYALNWRMKVVSLEWLQMSLERGMVLEESYFDPKMPVEERGKGAWERRATTSPTLGKRVRGLEDGLASNPLKRKLRRSASSKLGSQGEALWADITAASLERSTADDDDWTEGDLSNARAREAQMPQPEPEEDHENEAPPEDPPTKATERRGVFEEDAGIFQGRIILTHMFDAEKTRILRDHLTSNDGLVVHDPSELSGYPINDLKQGFLVTPHNVKPNLTSLPDIAGALTLATNWWVERCLHTKSLVDPAEHVLCRPFSNVAINGFEALVINSTGFTGIELLHVTKAVAIMGATYSEYLNKKTNVLICNNRKPSPEKFKFATDKRIPAVYAGWLWRCLQTGQLQSFGDDLLNKVQPQPETAANKPLESYVEVPTVRLSDADNEQRKKPKDHPEKAVSKSRPRTVQQRPGALALSYTTAPTLDSTRSSADPDTAGGWAANDEGVMPNLDGPSSHPLRDINPSVNSSRRPSASSNASSAKSRAASGSASSSNTLGDSNTLEPAPADRQYRAGKEMPPAVTAEPIPEEKDYSSIMSNILAQRKAAAEQQNQKKEESRRKKRQLGRAPSNPSTAGASLDNPLSRPGSAASADPSPVLLERDEEDKSVIEPQGYKPSQELGWDDPGAQAARERMIRAMGGRVEETGVTVVQPTGVMRDIVSGDGIGEGRGRRRRL